MHVLLCSKHAVLDSVVNIVFNVKTTCTTDTNNLDDDTLVQLSFICNKDNTLLLH